MEDTIAAISTSIGPGGIAIVRISGPQALTIADVVFHSTKGKPSEFPSHTIHWGTIGLNGHLLDEVLLTVMRAPRTYTTEDIVEINCHGGQQAARSILARCLESGARLAEPGEFTKRAFLNGRIDLPQAEAVMDLIHAKTQRVQKAAVNVLEGHLSRRVEKIYERLVGVLAHLEALIDFPDEDISPKSNEQQASEILAISDQIAQILATARGGKILRDGAKVTIFGRTNVGKSSLMNAILGRDRSIVSPIHGTTRDTLQELTDVKGIPILLHDTAGIRKAKGHVEAMGVSRSKSMATNSDLILHVIDNSRKFSNKERIVCDCFPQTPVIQVLHKYDLPTKLILPLDFPSHIRIPVSSLTGEGIESLINEMSRTLITSEINCTTETEVMINERHISKLQQCQRALDSAIIHIRENRHQEILVQELRFGVMAIGEIFGKQATEDMLDRIFRSFCIGK